jgi:hypothetical protein
VTELPDDPVDADDTEDEAESEEDDELGLSAEESLGMIPPD